MIDLTAKVLAYVLAPVLLPLMWVAMRDVKEACDAIENNPDFGGLEIKGKK